ncbi:hypothetical protein [Vibrio mediterranei]|nr:hypothetical protein [Vibrio mediterranei]
MGFIGFDGHLAPLYGGYVYLIARLMRTDKANIEIETLSLVRDGDGKS